MNKFAGIISFVTGVAVGSAATWFLLKTKYEQIAQEEIDSVKEVFSRKNDVQEEEIGVTEESEEDDEEDPSQKELNVIEYAATIIKDNEYDSEGTDEKKSLGVERPYVIPPEEYGELYDYEKFSLTYYADDVLADSDDEIVDDIEDVIGVESLTHFGEYEDDSVFVRNDKYKADYEILLDNRRYADVVKEKPYLTLMERAYD